MASADTYRPEVLIVDTNALLSDQALKLGERADRLMTVPEVIAEVRSETARRMLQIAPVEIPARVPSAEALAHGACAFRFPLIMAELLNAVDSDCVCQGDG